MYTTKAVSKLIVPLFIEQLLVTLIGQVNIMMVSGVGKQATSAVGMVDSLNFFIMAAFLAVATGSTVVIAQSNGRQDAATAAEAARQSLLSSVLLSVAVSLPLLLLGNPVLGLLFGAAEPAVMDNARIYFLFSVITYPLLALYSTCAGIFRGNGDTRTPMFVSVVMNIVNAGLGWLFMYHFHLGILGAALGMAAAKATGGVMGLLLLLYGNGRARLWHLFPLRFNWPIQRSIMAIGIPAAIETFIFNGGKMLTQIYIVSLGTISQAANVIAGSIFNLVCIPGNAIALAATTVVGFCVGGGDAPSAKRWLLRLVLFSSGLLLCTNLLFYPFMGQVISLYKPEPAVMAHTLNLLRLVALFMPTVWSFSFIMPAGLRGAGDAKFVTLSALIAMWFFRVVLGYVLGVALKMNIEGVYLAMFIDWIVRSILFFWRWKGGKWLRCDVLKNTVVK